MNDPQTLAIERVDRVAFIALNRPTVHNALNLLMLRELHESVLALDADATIGCVVVTGRGERAFCAGADIAELSALTDSSAGVAFARNGQALTRTIERLATPVIAAINGFAFGGGCELAMSADIRIAAAHAVFGQPEVAIGVMPGFGGTQRATRLLGRGAALFLCLTGEPIDASEALRLGLVQRVVPAESLRAEALLIARKIAANAPLAVTATKRAIVDGDDLPLRDALELEAAAFGALVDSADFHAGTRAFLEKRPRVFSGS